MRLSCHAAFDKVKAESDLVFALAGNPNVGKSTLFNSLTGLGVFTANYPGKTVEVNFGTTRLDGTTIGIIDLPGTYSITPISEDQWVARRAVLDGRPDVVIIVVDATNLARNLYMVLEFLDLELPIVVALNLVDEAQKMGISIDVASLSEKLGVPVVPTVASRGKGVRELVEEAVKRAREGPPPHPTYGGDIEESVRHLSARLGGDNEALGIPSRALAMLLLQEDPELMSIVGDEARETAKEIAAEISSLHGEPAPLRIARERHGLAGSVAAQVQSKRSLEMARAEAVWNITTSPRFGLPILALILLTIFSFVFFVGNLLSTIFSDAWTSYISPWVSLPFYAILGDTPLARTFIWGFDAGTNAALAVGIPYVLTFYFVLAFLEDSGYLTSSAFLTDKVMHKLGLHGRALISLVAGAGCNVPALIGTRTLQTKRERFIACTLIALVPCSARTAVIFGSVGLYLGLIPALTIYTVEVLLILLVGMGLNKILPGSSMGLVMEMFPFRRPTLINVARKTWFRFSHFLLVALPIVLLGSFVLGGLYESGYLWLLSKPLSPLIEGWLGLPAVAGLALLFAILRKELALQLLVALAIVTYGQGAESLVYFMDGTQLFVYALVTTIYIPCIAAIAAVGRELGWRDALLIMLVTMGLAVFLGGLVFRMLSLLSF